MFGSHLSIAGSLANALREAKRLKMDCVQIFTKNQRQWRVPPLRAEQVAEWREEHERMGWDEASRAPTSRARKEAEPSSTPDNTAPTRSRLCRVVSHNTYLINMASPDTVMWEKSVTLQRVEIERCEELAIPCCVAHPGAHLGDAAPRSRPRDTSPLIDGCTPTRHETDGLKRIIKALNRIHRETPGHQTLTCLETTVGSGTNLGYCFEQLAYIRDHVKQPERVAFCFDTCHVTAAGYDMTTDEKAQTVLEHFDAVCGLDQLQVLHMNDSVGSIGSRRDRHAHIGEGTCGRACFRTIVNSLALQGVPKILETPKEDSDKGVPMDVINIRRLKRLRRRSPSTRTAALR